MIVMTVVDVELSSWHVLATIVLNLGQGEIRYAMASFCRLGPFQAMTNGKL